MVGTYSGQGLERAGPRAISNDTASETLKEKRTRGKIALLIFWRQSDESLTSKLLSRLCYNEFSSSTCD